MDLKLEILSINYIVIKDVRHNKTAFILRYTGRSYKAKAIYEDYIKLLNQPFVKDYLKRAIECIKAYRHDYLTLEAQKVALERCFEERI